MSTDTDAVDQNNLDSDSSTSSITTSIYDHLEEILSLSEKNFSCSICNDTMVLPSTISCGHTFCTQCIKDWFDTRQNCPCCREPCVGGDHSAPVELITEYLKRLKPLLQYRRLQINNSNTNNNQDIPSTQLNTNNLPEHRPLSPKDDKKLVEFIGQTLMIIQSEKDWICSDQAVLLTRMALASESNTDKILSDIDNLPMESFIDKYCKFEKKEDHKDYQYLPVIRTTEYKWHWPNRQGWTQLAGYFFFIVVLMYVIDLAEQSRAYPAFETLLRVVIVISVFEFLFRDMI